MIAAREETHVLMDELDINWAITSSEVQTFRVMWEADMSIDRIAEELGCMIRQSRGTITALRTKMTVKLSH